MWNIFVDRLSTSPEAIVGVGFIAVYFVWMVSRAIMRIHNAEHMHH